MASIIIENTVTNAIITGSEAPTPLVFLPDQKCDEQLNIKFSEEFGNQAGQYANPVWEIFGPHDNPLGWTFDAGSGTGAFSDPAAFTMRQPGRYLFRLTALPFGAGTVVQFTALVEVRDPQIRDTSYTAPNEKDEFDPDEGWGYSVLRYHDALTKLYSDKTILTVKSAAVLPAGTPVIPTSGYWEQWGKADVASAADFKNLVVTVTAATADNVDILTLPIFTLLEAVDPAVSSGRGIAAWFGMLPIDTDTPGWSEGDPLFIDSAANNGGFTNIPPAAPLYAREVGRVFKPGGALPGTPGVLATMPGLIWLFGMGSDQIPGMVAGPLSSTDHAITLWEGDFGNALQDSNIFVNHPSDPSYVAEADANPADGVGDGYGGTSTIAARTMPGNWGVAGNNLVVRTGDANHAAAVPGKVEIRGGSNPPGVGGAVHIMAGSGATPGHVVLQESNSGLVGVGKTPTEKLDVAGKIVAEGGLLVPAAFPASTIQAWDIVGNDKLRLRSIANQNVEIDPQGTGILEVLGDSRFDGDVEITGTLDVHVQDFKVVADQMTLGDEPSDVVIIKADSASIPNGLTFGGPNNAELLILSEGTDRVYIHDASLVVKTTVTDGAIKLSPTGPTGEAKVIAHNFDANAPYSLKIGGNTLRFSIGPAGATDAMFIDSSGKVGVGTTTPSTKLDVDGSIFVSNLKTIGRDNGTIRNANIQFADVSPLGNAAIVLRDGGSDLMIVDGSGNVGIGTTSPTKKLHVEGDVKITGVIDPTALVFDEAAPPTTGATEGGLFVSDGSGALVQNELYYRKASDGATEAVMGANLTDYSVPTGYATVQAAVDAASAAGGGTVYVKPGIYVEDLRFKTGVTVTGLVSPTKLSQPTPDYPYPLGGKAVEAVTIRGFAYSDVGAGEALSFEANNIHFQGSTPVGTSAVGSRPTVRFEGAGATIVGFSNCYIHQRSCQDLSGTFTVVDGNNTVVSTEDQSVPLSQGDSIVFVNPTAPALVLGTIANIATANGVTTLTLNSNVTIDGNGNTHSGIEVFKVTRTTGSAASLQTTSETNTIQFSNCSLTDLGQFGVLVGSMSNIVEHLPTAAGSLEFHECRVTRGVGGLSHSSWHAYEPNKPAVQADGSGDITMAHTFVSGAVRLNGCVPGNKPTPIRVINPDGAGLGVVETYEPHMLYNGDRIVIAGSGATLNAGSINASAPETIVVSSPGHPALKITGVTTGADAVFTTELAHKLQSGDRVRVLGHFPTTNLPEINGTYEVNAVTGETNFTLTPAVDTSAGDNISQGTTFIARLEFGIDKTVTAGGTGGEVLAISSTNGGAWTNDHINLTARDCTFICGESDISSNQAYASIHSPLILLGTSMGGQGPGVNLHNCSVGFASGGVVSGPGKVRLGGLTDTFGHLRGENALRPTYIDSAKTDLKGNQGMSTGWLTLGDPEQPLTAGVPGQVRFDGSDFYGFLPSSGWVSLSSGSPEAILTKNTRSWRCGMFHASANNSYGSYLVGKPTGSLERFGSPSEPGADAAFSLSIWFNTHEALGGALRTLVSRNLNELTAGSAYADGWHLSVTDGSATGFHSLVFAFTDNNSDTDLPGGMEYTVGIPAIPDGGKDAISLHDWHNVCVTVDFTAATGGAYMWLDGELVAEMSRGGPADYQQLTGLVSTNGFNTTVTGSNGTQFTTELQSGDILYLPAIGNDTFGVVDSIISDTELTTIAAFSGAYGPTTAATSAVYWKEVLDWGVTATALKNANESHLTVGSRFWYNNSAAPFATDTAGSFSGEIAELAMWDSAAITKTGAQGASVVYGSGSGIDLLGNSLFAPTLVGFWDFQHHSDALGSSVQLPKSVQSTNAGWTDSLYYPMPTVQCVTNRKYPGVLDLWPESIGFENGGPTGVVLAKSGATAEVLPWKVPAETYSAVTVADYVDVLTALPRKEVTATGNGMYLAYWPWTKPAKLHQFEGIPGQYGEKGFVVYYDATGLTGLGPTLELLLIYGNDPVYPGTGMVTTQLGSTHSMPISTGIFTVDASAINAVSTLSSSSVGTMFRWVLKVSGLANGDVVSLHEPRLFYVK